MDRLRKLFNQYAGKSPEEMVEIASSGSSRRYFRMKAGEVSVIGVIGTCVDENRAFLEIDRHFREVGINVPAVLAVGEDMMIYIQEDLGTVQLFGLLASGRESGDYRQEDLDILCQTMGMLPKIQFEGGRGLDYSLCYPDSEFNSRMVMFDLNYFKYCFLKTTGLEFNEVRLQDDFERLKDDLMACMGDTFMYRDFQARNVMVRDGEPYFIDFQGGRRGPIYYDVASFVWQARSRFPASLRKAMVESYLKGLRQYVEVDEPSFWERLRIFVLFRTLQVLGAYGFRGCFEKKTHFIESIPYAIGNLRDLLQTPFENYPYLSELLGDLTRMPKYCANFGDSAAKDDRLEVQVSSFSYKKGVPADCSGNGGGYVFDCRSINNPGRYEKYRHSTGLDADVISFLEDDGEILEFLNEVYAIVDAHVRRFIERGFTHLQVSFGCTGGHHRSVYCAEHLASHLHESFDVRIALCHQELGIKRTIS